MIFQWDILMEMEYCISLVLQNSAYVKMITTVKQFIQKHERYLSVGALLTGFLWDTITLSLPSVIVGDNWVINTSIGMGQNLE